MFKNYFKTALRNLTRNKVYSFINITGLSLGLACSMLIILYVKDEVSYDRFHGEVNRIYRITSQSFNKKENKIDWNSNTGYLQGPRFTANIPGIQSFVRIQSQRRDIKKGTDVTSHEMLDVDSNFFSMFNFPLIEGNPKTCLRDPHSIVLSEDEAKKQFGTRQAMGKTVMMKDEDDFIPYTVTAVAKKCPQNSSIKFEILVPMQESVEDAQNSENWFNFFLNTFVILSPHADVKTVETKMKKFYDEDTKEAIKSLTAKYGPEVADWKADYQLQPFLDMHLSKELAATEWAVRCQQSGVFLYSFRYRHLYFIDCFHQFCQPDHCPFSKTCERDRDPESGWGRKNATHYSVPGRIAVNLSVRLFIRCAYCATDPAGVQ